MPGAGWPSPGRDCAGSSRAVSIVRILLLLAWLPALVLVVALALWGLFEQGSRDGAESAAADSSAGRRRRSARLPASGVDDRLFDVLQVRDLLHHAVGGDRGAEPDQPRSSLQRLAAVFLPPADATGLLPRQARRHCRAGGRGGGPAGGRRLRAGRLLQPRPERDPRHLAFAAGQHPLWPGDCRLGRNAHAGPVVAVAAVALRGHRLGRFVDHQLGGCGRAWRHPARGPLSYHLAGGDGPGQSSMQNDQPLDPDEPPPERGRRNRGVSGERGSGCSSASSEPMAEAAPTNWRPLCSYTANLQRLGEALLNTDAAWVEIGRAIEVPRAALKPFLGRGGSSAESAQINKRRLADQLVPQYPWIWSAGVLAGLLGLSLWTLSMRVKSLDRLK